jgi:hypothetical protein
MIYGYSAKQVNEYGLMEMREVTFATSPEVLREIADFLNAMADLMEKGGFRNCSHRHIDNVVRNWRNRFPDKDVVVMPAIEDG